MPRATCLLIAAALALFAVSCSGGDSGGDRGLPKGIPTFTGAHPLTGSQLDEENAFTGSWTTDQDVATVREYFERELGGDGEWRIVETREIENGVVIRVEDVNDPSHVGTIIVRREGSATRIAKTIVRKGGGGDDEEDGDPGDVTQGALPPGYPADIPLPEDAEVLSGSAPQIDGERYYLVEFTTSATPAGVIAFFNSGLGAQGWQPGASHDDPAGFAINFTRGGDRLLVTGGGDESGTSASITIIIAG
jgi:hypothetical protein